MKKIKYLFFTILIAFLANITIPFFYSNHFTKASAAINIKYQTTETKKILICTKEGFKWVEVEKKENPSYPFSSSTKDHDEKNSNPCQSCFINAKVISNNFDNYTSPLIHIDSIQDSLFYILFEDHVYYQINLLSSYSRAPPYQV
jgi:hypothetical protein